MKRDQHLPHARSRRLDPRILWPCLALALLLAFNFAFSRDFLTFRVENGRLYGGLIDILDNATPLILVSLGMAVVIGTGGIDLSVGAIMAIAGAVVAGLVARPPYSILAQVDVGGSIALALAAGLVVALLFGCINGGLVAILGVQPLMATLVLMVSGRGVAQLLTSGQIITFHDPALEFLARGAGCGIPATIWIALGAIVLVGSLMRWTALGLFAEAIGDNRAAAILSGVPVRGVVCFGFGLTGLLAGAAGALEAADISAADSNNAGLYIELDAILAVVLGGTALTGGRFSLMGAVVGALLIQTLTMTILAQGVAEDATLLVKAAMVLGLCLLQSERLRDMVARSFVRARRPPS